MVDKNVYNHERQRIKRTNNIFNLRTIKVLHKIKIYIQNVLSCFKIILMFIYKGLQSHIIITRIY